MIWCHYNSTTLRSGPVTNVSKLISTKRKYNSSANPKWQNAIGTADHRFRHEVPESMIPKSERTGASAFSSS